MAVFAASSIQAATLVAAPSVLVTDIDTRSAQTSVLSETREFTLEPGVHSIAYRYDQLFEPSADDHEFVRSKSMVALITVDDPTDRFELKPTQNPMKLDAAKDFAETASINVIKNGEVVQTTTADSNNTSIVAALGNLVNQVTAEISSGGSGEQSTAAREDLLNSFELIWNQTNQVEKQYIRSVVAP